jgi:serine/threonine-protein kinase
LHNLGNAHAAAGNPALAEEEIRRALAVREAALPAGHPDIAASLTDLARVLRMQGRPEDALPIDRRAVAAGEKAFGAEHPVFANQLIGFGIALGRVGRHAEADAQLRRAEAILTKQFGPAHVEVLNVRAARGDLLMQQARWREAKALYEQIVPALSTSQGAGSLPSARANLARAYVELHQPARALPSLEQLAHNLDALPPRARADIELSLARALWDSGGDRARARALGEDALRTLTAAGDTAAIELTQIKRWLASHRPR